MCIPLLISRSAIAEPMTPVPTHPIDGLSPSAWDRDRIDLIDVGVAVRSLESMAAVVQERGGGGGEKRRGALVLFDVVRAQTGTAGGAWVASVRHECNCVKDSSLFHFVRHSVS